MGTPGRQNCTSYDQYVYLHVMLNARPPSDAQNGCLCATGMVWLKKALSKKCLAWWLCECISQAFARAGGDPPTLVRTHSTCSVAVSVASFSGMSVEDICMVVSWSTPCPFIRFYLLDMSGPPRLVKNVGVCVSFVSPDPPLGTIHLRFSHAP